MPRLNKDGKFIISASEVGSYTVCPESWRLRSVLAVNREDTDRSKKGMVKHDEWTVTYDEHLFLARSSRIVLALLILAIAAFLLISEHSIVLP